MKYLLSLAAILTMTAAAPAGFAASTPSDKFPFRAQYDVNTVDTAALKQRFNEFIVVDVRSKYEYDTLHVRDAYHLALSDVNFVNAVRALVQRNPQRPIVFYCNGTTCRKSYDAASRSDTAGIRNTFVYDAGIHEWVTSFPDLAVLRGHTPRLQELISEEEFKRHLVSGEEFEKLVENNIGSKAIVLDIRDRIQRDVLLWPLRGEVRAPLDDRARIDEVLDQAKRDNKLLLVYDAAGHQIRWFQYHLKEKGVTNYRLMRGGVHAYFASRYDEPETKVAATKPLSREQGTLVRVKSTGAALRTRR